jgi:isoleucyl-tRNA synthetase
MNADERQALTPITLREKAAKFAKEAVARQSASFQRYGVIGDFDNPYLTLLPEYEAAQVRVFGEMYKNGYIYRGRKPVHWSPSSRTALAEAELEYPEGHVSKSIYVALDVVSPSDELKDIAGDGNLKVAIWTTTPWTIPANLAVAINPELEYCVVDAHAHVLDGKSKLVVASGLVSTLESKFELPEGEKLHVLITFPGSSLVGTTYRHPLYDRTSPVIAGGDYITTESGTGLVHTAPGHGQEDYLTGLKYGLELLSPVDDEGKFTIEAGSSTTVGDAFVGKSVLGDGNIAVIDALRDVGALILVQDYGHKYPYDWRTKKPTIFRATDQWFASVEGFRDEALKAVDTVQWIPDVGKNRINSFIVSRGDWCISRQRSWGVPIPVFYDKETAGTKVLLDEDTLNHIQSVFAEHGSDAWWTMDVIDLLPEKYRGDADKWAKGTDTMDVWFDSGSSWAGVVQERAEKEFGLSFPADIYLEGSDQHRGWFQSSLLTSVAASGRAPYKAVLTHGFVLDEKGFKMSKSLGNVVNPLLVIEGGNNKKEEPAYGADVLRLWVASVDYAGDVRVGPNIIKQTFESYRKLRNTARYLVGNLADYNPTTDAVPYDDLPSMDKWMLGTMSQVLNEIDDAYSSYQFGRVSNELLRFATADLSNFYLDVAKDRLYISAVNDPRRRSCQTVIHALLEGFAKAIAPILPHMAEDIWQNLPYKSNGDNTSVFETGYSKELMSYPAFDTEMWNLVRDIRSDVNQVLEVARQDKLVGASLDAAAYIYTSDDKIRKILNQLDGDESLITPSIKTNGVDELRTALMMSQVKIVDSEEQITSSCDAAYIAKGELSGCFIGVKKAEGTKCGRCWFYDREVGTHDRYGEDVCQRCDDAIQSWEELSGNKFTSALLEKAPVV